jgi:peroxiredoxin
MLTSMDFSDLFNQRFYQNFFPIPPKNSLELGEMTPDFRLPDITNKFNVKLSDYWDKQPVVLAFTRIFTAKQYCPLCLPHIKALNHNYDRFLDRGVEVLMITSTDKQQSRHVVNRLGLNIPFLSDSDCSTFKAYSVGQALGAPLPGQFILDRSGKLRFKHIFSFLSPHADVESLLDIVEQL